MVFFFFTSSIGVFIFEQTIGVPVIAGLLAYRENNDQMNIELKNKYLRSINLNISYPDVIKLTTITLALAKMLRSNTLVNLILTVIRKNLFNRKMSTDHSNVRKTKYRDYHTLYSIIYNTIVLFITNYYNQMF